MKISKVLLGLGCLFSIDSAMASGYGLKLNSGWNAGMASAGSGVTADPLAGFVNPATNILCMTHEIAAHATGVFPHVRFKGTASAPAIGVPIPGVGLVPTSANTLTGKTQNAGEEAVVPSLGIVAVPAERVRVGLTVTAPYGLEFDYGANSITRAHSTWSSMQTIDVVPTVALRITNWLTAGVGYQMQYANLKFNRKAILGNGGPAGFGSTQLSLEGTNWTTGWTAGLLFELTKAWKMGLSYRSRMINNLDGKIVGNVANPSALFLGGATTFQGAAKIHFPHVATFSTSYDITDKLTAYGDFVFTWWNAVNAISIRTFTGSATGNRTSTDVIPLMWKNSWFFSLGANYKLNENWAVRAGYAYDHAPSRNSTRIVGIPDSNKQWVAVGTTYTHGNLSTTLSYGHEFFSQGKVMLNPTTSSPLSTQLKGSLNGKIKASVDLVSLQVNWKIG